MVTWFGKLKSAATLLSFLYTKDFLLNSFLVNTRTILDYITYKSKVNNENVGKLFNCKLRKKWVVIPTQLYHVWLYITFLFAFTEWKLSLDTVYISKFKNSLNIFKSFPNGSMVKSLPANTEDTGLISGLGISPGEGNGTYSSILAWKLPWTQEPGRLQYMELQKVGHNLVTEQ